jgi:hypothetical protein
LDTVTDSGKGSNSLVFGGPLEVSQLHPPLTGRVWARPENRAPVFLQPHTTKNLPLELQNQVLVGRIQFSCVLPSYGNCEPPTGLLDCLPSPFAISAGPATNRPVLFRWLPAQKGFAYSNPPGFENRAFYYRWTKNQSGDN